MQGASAAAIIRHKLGNSRPEPQHVDTWALGIIAVIAVICGMAVGLLTLWVRADHDLPKEMVRVQIGSQRVSIPSTWLVEQNQSGRIAERLELLIPLADLGIEGAGEGRMTVMVAPSDTSIHPADRPAQLYARFVTSEYRPGPSGLIKRSFRNEAAFQGENLYVAPPDGRVFSARCQEQDNVRPSCFSEFRIGSLDIRSSYTLSVLPYWPLIVETLQQRFAGSDLRF